MSAAFRLAKQKPSQQELRRLMNEKKASLANNSSAARTPIDSPLAKYNDQGQLQCLLCKSIVRSADVWKVHVNAKQHRQNVELAKQLKEKTNNFTQAAGGSSAGNKRPAAEPQSTSVPEKRLKSILKNSSSSSSEQQNTTPSGGIPSDFFDSPKGSVHPDLSKINRDQSLNNNGLPNQQPMDVTESKTAVVVDESLPEGFFDDPVKDAKARNLEYRDPVEEEWERFQKEIKVAAETSNAIIAEDQIEATTERQIDEIDEQIRNWSRVLSLEKKKELVRESMARARSIHENDLPQGDELADNHDDDDEDDDANVDEFLDWRAKRSHLRKPKLDQ